MEDLMEQLGPTLAGVGGGLLGAFVGGKAVANAARNKVNGMKQELLGDANPFGAKLARGVAEELAEFWDENDEKITEKAKDMAYKLGEEWTRGARNEVIEALNANAKVIGDRANTMAYGMGDNFVQGACDRLGKILLSTVAGIVIGMVSGMLLPIILPIIMPFIVGCFIIFFISLVYSYIFPYTIRKHSNTTTTWKCFYIAKVVLLLASKPNPATFWILFIYSVYVDFVTVKAADDDEAKRKSIVLKFSNEEVRSLLRFFHVEAADDDEAKAKLGSFLRFFNVKTADDEEAKGKGIVLKFSI